MLTVICLIMLMRELLTGFIVKMLNPKILLQLSGFTMQAQEVIYSTSSQEQSLLAGDISWVNEGIAWYGDATDNEISLLNILLSWLKFL